MAHQFVREPLRAEEADRLANACRSPEEKLVARTLLDTGLRVSELCSLTRDNVQWQQRSLRVNRFGKYTLNLDRDSPTLDYALDLRPGMEPTLATASV